MIKPTFTLETIYSHYLKRNVSLVTFLLLLSGGIANAQSKLDTKFEKLIDVKLKNKGSNEELKKIAEENELAISAIVQPNGNVEELYHAIVYTNQPKKFDKSEYHIQSYSKNFFTSLLSIEQIQELSSNNEILFIDSPEYSYPSNIPHLVESGANLLHAGVLNNHSFMGSGVLIGILDTGIDFKHPDFNSLTNPNQTRILRLWDQTLTKQDNENTPAGFSYGVEYLKSDIDDEIDGTPTGFVRQKDINGHGTHVAGTAAGSGLAHSDKLYKGTAPNADLIIVKGGDGGFSEANIVNGLEYFKNVAQELNRPIVVNMSLGGLQAPKDDKSPQEMKVNEFTESGAGRVVVIAGGNNGDENAHKEITLAPNEKKTFSIQTNTPQNGYTGAGLFNFIAINRNANDNSPTRLKITAPNGDTFQINENSYNTFVSPLPSGSGNYSIYTENSLWSANNPKRYNYVSITRDNRSNNNTQGIFIVELENISNNNIIIDGWITTNSSYPLTSIVGGDNNYTIGSPGTASNAITVANHIGNSFAGNPGSGYYTWVNGKEQNRNLSSSIGPRVDGYQKPDISADGSNVTSALSSDMQINTVQNGSYMNQYYRSITGTSMATPGVAGSVALLFEANPNLTNTEVKSILKNTARKDEFTTNDYTPQLGYGKINVYKAVQYELNKRNNNQNCPVSDFTMLGYDNNNKFVDSNNTLTTHFDIGNNNKIAVRYTPLKAGQLTSVYALLGFNTLNSSLHVDIKKSTTDGKPGDLLGSKIIPTIKDNVRLMGWNNFDVSDLNINLNANEDIFVELYVDNATDNLRMFFDNQEIDGRTYIYSKTGVIGNALSANDAKIRLIINEENSNQVHQLATANSTTVQNFTEGLNQIVNNCELVARVESSGANPITGKNTTRLWLDNYDLVFVNRRIELNSELQNTTGKVTLFFTQEEFNQFNANNQIKLPISSTDNGNFGNLKVYYFNGTSSDNSGKHTSYSENAQIITIDANDVKWNTENEYWEVSLDYLGNGGYFLTTASTLNNVDLSLSDIQIYPNPVVDQLNITLPNSIKNGQVKVYDMIGKLIVNTTINNNTKIDLSKNPQGLYIVEIKTDKGVINKKILKK